MVKRTDGNDRFLWLDYYDSSAKSRMNVLTFIQTFQQSQEAGRY